MQDTYCNLRIEQDQHAPEWLMVRYDERMSPTNVQQRTLRLPKILLPALATASVAELARLFPA